MKKSRFSVLGISALALLLALFSLTACGPFGSGMPDSNSTDSPEQAVEDKINTEDFGSGADIKTLSGNLQNSLNAIADESGNYVFNLTGSHTLTSTNAIALKKANVSLRGTGTINVGSADNLFDIESKLIVRGPTLQGKTGASNPLLYVNGGELILRTGNIKGNENTSGSGGGVLVASSGKFTMHDGTISDNNATNGGGVSVDQGTFDMKGGTIEDNNASQKGGGVYVGSVPSGSSFTKSGGIISGNKTTAAANQGNAVYVVDANGTTGGTGDRYRNVDAGKTNGINSGYYTTNQGTNPWE